MPPGKRCRLGPLNPHSKVAEVSNQLGHFINALKQSLNTTKTTISATTQPTRSSVIYDRMHYETGFSNAGSARSDGLSTIPVPLVAPSRRRCCMGECPLSGNWTRTGRSTGFRQCPRAGITPPGALAPKKVVGLSLIKAPAKLLC
jgi:hypothetical protein